MIDRPPPRPPRASGRPLGRSSLRLGYTFGVAERPPLTLNLDDPEGRPYFLWDETTTNRALRRALVEAAPSEKARLLGKLMREARDTDVWRFTTVAEVRSLFPAIKRYLGRRRAFWQYLLGAWERHGLA